MIYCSAVIVGIIYMISSTCDFLHPNLKAIKKQKRSESVGINNSNKKVSKMFGFYKATQHEKNKRVNTTR